MSASALVCLLQVPADRIAGILDGQRATTRDTALRLAHFLGTSPKFWLNLRKLFELRMAAKKICERIKALPTLKK